MVFTNSFSSVRILNPIYQEIIDELPDELPDNSEEPKEEPKEEQIKESWSLEASFDSTNEYIYESVVVKVLDQEYTIGNQITSLKISLGANEKTSTVNVEVIDPDLKIADTFFKHSRANGGIKLPVEFGSTTPPSADSPGSSGGFGGKTLTLSELDSQFNTAVLYSQSGTYWVVTADGYCMTAKHVIDSDGQSPNLEGKDGKKYTSKVIESDNNDLSLVKIDNVSGLPINYLAPDLSCYTPTVTDKVIYTIGHGAKDGGGGRNKWLATESEVFSVEASATESNIQGEAIKASDQYNGKSWVNSGNSGGPAYDHWGLIVGVVCSVSGGVQGPGEYAICSSLKNVKALLDKNKVAYSTGSRTATVPPPSGSTPDGNVNVDDIPDGLKDDALAKVIVAYAKTKANVTSAFHLGCILGTCEIESSMGVWLKEIGGESASYAPWFGRGLIQVTHKANYEKVGTELGLGKTFFTDNPDELTRLKYAVPALIIGMRDGWYTGKKLSDYSDGDYDGTRNIVNPGETGTRRQNYISYAKKWQGRVSSNSISYVPRYELPPNNGTQSRQIPGITPPSQKNANDDDRFPSTPRRPTSPGGSPSLSPNIRPSVPGNVFPPSGSQPFPEDPSTDDPVFPGFPNPGQPNNPDDPVNPNPEPNPDPNNPDDPNSQPDGSEDQPTLTTPTVGNPIEVILKTNNGKSFTFNFILFSDSISDFPSPSFEFSGKSIRYQLAVDSKTENFENVTPQEFVRILAARYSINLVDKTENTVKNNIDLIDQRNQTDQQTLSRVLEATELDIIDDPRENTIELEDKNKPKKPQRIILGDIIDLKFFDEGVVDEKPLYPVSLTAFTTDELLALKPEDSISLDNVYDFIPKSLKADSWVINTITHDIIQETTQLELTKYIPVPKQSTPGSSGGTTGGTSGGVMTEDQIKEKYKSAVVKVGSASGCFVSADGYILTAAHMAGDNQIETAEGKKYTAKDVDVVESADIMLMKVEGSGFPVAPIAPDTSIYKKGEKGTIIKYGHGGSTESDAVNGRKYWDVTTSFVREVVKGFRGLTGLTIVADDKEIDFVNPGDSGCPWFDSYGLIVSCTSGGDRSHAEGPGKKDASWGGAVEEIIKMLDKNKVAYTKGTRQAITDPTPSNPGGTPGSPNSTGGDGKVPGWTNPCPTGVLTSRFGPRDSPTAGASSNHKGVDLAGGEGTPILAACAGTVIDADDNTNGSGYGIYVVIGHAEKRASLYGHLKSKSVKKGDKVTMGQQIGKEDNTGTSTGSHLHFGIAEGVTGDNIWASGKFVDPINYIKIPGYGRYSALSFDTSNFHGCIVDLDSQLQSRFRDMLF